MKPCLAVIMPVYNERRYIAEIIQRVLAQKCVAQLVIVDDLSTDGTREYLQSLKEDKRLWTIFQHYNQGKGMAIHSGLNCVLHQPYVIVQDADLEYNPADYERLLNCIVKHDADAVFGSRYLYSNGQVLPFWHRLVNKFLTLFSNAFTNLNLTDMETCYKLFKTDVLRKIDIQEFRFAFEPEMAAKVAKMKLKVFEVPVSYEPRTKQLGKKINWKDGIRALWCIVKYGVKA